MEKIFKADALTPVTVTGSGTTDVQSGSDVHFTIMSQSKQVLYRVSLCKSCTTLTSGTRIQSGTNSIFLA